MVSIIHSKFTEKGAAFYNIAEFHLSFHFTSPRSQLCLREWKGIKSCSSGCAEQGWAARVHAVFWSWGSAEAPGRLQMVRACSLCGAER